MAMWGLTISSHYYGFYRSPVIQYLCFIQVFVLAGSKNLSYDLVLRF